MLINKSGLSRARAKGKQLGRKPHGEDVEEEIKKLRAGGMGKVKIGKTLGIGMSALQRVLVNRFRFF
ncbi:MAG TPA: hypothetical protein VIE65_23565 [Methylobacter sp.]|jgi:DNA invertase Pin-like site-specific DNA recombinase